MAEKEEPCITTVITTHANADFDAVGSLVAAQKLYPDGAVIFPGFHEKSLKHFFVSSLAYLLNLTDASSIDFSRINRLVIVDTKQASRIGQAAALLDKPGLEIHIFDHHPPQPDDIQADYMVSRPTGANVTLLVEILKENGIDISPEEATIMCLGIYEDTGSFTYQSTTSNDFLAAAYLREKGADIGAIADLITKEMDPKQISLLNDMIRSAVSYPINGIDIAVTCVSTDDYIHDLAFLVQKMLRIENFQALFAIAQMKHKIYIAARSRTPLVDVGAIARKLGGGGHRYAAAATIRGEPLAQVESRLVKLIKEHAGAIQTAREIMSSPPITAPHTMACKEARRMMTRYNVNALLITGKDGKLAGFITRQVIEKALFLRLGDLPVSEYMTSEFTTVPPEAGIAEIQERIIESKQRILPVVEGDKILGVITRTDLLNTIVSISREREERFPEIFPESGSKRMRNIAGLLKERLSARIYSLLQKIGETAGDLGCRVYVVGGFVRDLFLFHKNEDIDIVVEGDGIAFASELARRVGGRINAFAKFGTAVVIFPDGFKIDVATARVEYYKAPAALPTVEMSSIKLDLFRRDFTINTLAIVLNPDKFGYLIDFFGAQRDIKEKIIRVLHNLSFVEDPTRAFRAVRFEQRFGFTIGKLTLALIENAVKMEFFKRLSGKRVFAELIHILEEENPLPALLRIDQLGLLSAIDPALALSKKTISDLEAAKRVTDWYDLLYTGDTYKKWAVYFMIILRRMDVAKADSLCSKFELPPKKKRLLCDERLEAEHRMHLLHREIPNKNSELYEILSPFKTEQLLYMMAVSKSEAVRRAISIFVTDLRDIKPEISGKDLMALGIKPSPLYGRLLSKVLAEKLDGGLVSRKAEIEYVKKLLEQEQ